MMKQSKNYFIERHQGGERAILVQLNLNQLDFEDSLTEFKLLANAASVDALEVVTGKRTAPNPKYFLGTGKAEAVSELVRALDAEVVLINHALTPGQGRNLEKLFNCRVLDRTELILDIFAQRARTYEGKLQVELAQLQHLRTRLVRGWTHLERQKGGIGLRGPGETQLETDRRLLGLRIKSIEKRLKKVVGQREQGRRSRQRAEVPTLSLVGYTNAGKSTLFNALTESSVEARDQLFATLDPTLRQIKIPAVGEAVLADTVGFIRDLPHDLVAAFRATLEETRQASLLLHVVDASRTDYQNTIDDVEMVLKEINADTVPCIQVMNKLDLCSDANPRIDYSAPGQPRRVWLSAVTGQGFDLLEKAISELLEHRLINCELVLTHEQAKLRAELYRLHVVEQESLDEQGHWHLQVKMQARDYNRLINKE